MKYSHEHATEYYVFAIKIAKTKTLDLLNLYTLI